MKCCEIVKITVSQHFFYGKGMECDKIKKVKKTKQTTG